jgi:hypothetical protein
VHVPQEAGSCKVRSWEVPSQEGIAMVFPSGIREADQCDALDTLDESALWKQFVPLPAFGCSATPLFQ